jgi:hypothetical protein
MTTLMTVTINTNASSDGGTRRSETQQIAYLLEQIAQQVNSGAALSNAALTDRNGNNVGSWTYTPVASS